MASPTRSFRAIATLAILVLLVGVSLAATVEVIRQGLPQPPALDQVDLVQYLSTRDVRALLPDDRDRMTRRLEREFHDRKDWQTALDGLEPPQWRQFAANFDRLLTVWFGNKVREYGALKDEDRQKYLDEQIETFMLLSWYPQRKEGAQPGDRRRGAGQRPEVAGDERRQRREGESRGPGNRRRSMLGANVAERVQELIRRSTPEEQQLARQFVADLQMRVLDRTGAGSLLRPQQ